jgi:DNA-directed RNA polymerase subunit RPC12/RpoP
MKTIPDCSKCEVPFGFSPDNPNSPCNLCLIKMLDKVRQQTLKEITEK